ARCLWRIAADDHWRDFCSPHPGIAEARQQARIHARNWRIPTPRHAARSPPSTHFGPSETQDLSVSQTTVAAPRPPLAYLQTHRASLGMRDVALTEIDSGQWTNWAAA
ncbi:MAG: hypothetical protein KGI63_13175, partial [Xanthomonadaceae bacterium]|nr:hypothetical protein [Xanthomonadaceae bacterium]